MKKCGMCKGDPNPEVVYQLDDLYKLKPLFEEAYKIWIREWEKRGKKDYGSCCLQKGISLCFIGPRKRYYRTARVIDSPPVQGNMAVMECVYPSLYFLKSHGVRCFYDDGIMD